MLEVRVPNSSDSPLLHPRHFLIQALRDLGRAVGPAKHLLRASLASRHRYSALRLVWLAGPAGLMAAALVLGARGRVPGIHPGSVPAPLIGVLGITLLTTLLDAFNQVRTLFDRQALALARTGAPLEALLLARYGEAVTTSAVRLAVVTPLLFVLGARPGLGLVSALLGAASLSLLGGSIGLFAAPWQILSRDAARAFDLFGWVLLLLLPVFAPLSQLSFQSWNPIAHLFELSRNGFAGGPAGPGTSLALASLAAVLPLSAVGWLFSRIAAPHVFQRVV